ncbi:hypothetical protein BYT27DRAFT_7263004 [Phlegmacium glaucopus]|nr:hypothetical protein BYT27DRAFT_7263004 [Phlegmacium glaucopus]
MSKPLILKVDIAHEDLVTLRAGGFNFCLSRAVQFNGTLKPGNVVFCAVPSKQLAPRIGVQWKDEYQVYGTTQPKTGEVITADTEIGDIVGDQVATIHEDCTVKIWGGHAVGAPFRVENEWKDQACIGVSNYNVGSKTYSSFFVSPKVAKPSECEILPMQLYTAFWNTKLATNTMFEPPADRFVFALTPGMAEITLTYKDKTWAIEQLRPE